MAAIAMATGDRSDNSNTSAGTQTQPGTHVRTKDPMETGKFDLDTGERTQ